jgi:hypothetical protein
MADTKHQDDGPVEIYDREIDLKRILGFTGGLVAVTLVVLAVMWWMSTSFKQQEEANDRAPSPLAEARLDPIPPGPRLQPSPPRDMDELRAKDREALTTYGWVDPAEGVARIPVARAIEIVADKGLAAARPAEPTKGAK